MEQWTELLEKPAHLSDNQVAEKWFERIAGRLLNGCRLVVNSQPHRLTEIEFYYHSDEHPDVFAHRDPMQVKTGLWYFHRSRGAYRGGSFKGVDLTFGTEGAHAGILFRGMEKPSGELVDGPSLCVDHLLATTGKASVAELDQAIDGRLAWESANPLQLEWLAETEDRVIYSCPRVGLSLWGKPGPTGDKRWSFLMRPYRKLTEPSRIKKGKAQMVVSLLDRGLEPSRIHELTKCPRKTIERYQADYEEGKQSADPTPYFGVDLTPSTLCKVYGCWTAGRTSSASRERESGAG